MPRAKNPVPAYSHHRPSGQAYVRLPDGAGRRKTVYLGPYESDHSRQEYARLVAELAASPATLLVGRPTDAGGSVVTVNDVLLAFLKHADRHYRRADGSPTGELSQYRQTFRLVKELYGRAPTAEFGPRALRHCGSG